MEAVEFLKAMQRMCIAETCEKCPLGLLGESIEATCHGAMRALPEKSVEVVKAWADAHPEKTRRQDFFEKYPDAPVRDPANYPTACCFDLGYVKECPSIDCEECWNQPV